MADLRDGFYSLSKDVNKVDSLDSGDSVLLPELELSMEEDELLELKKLWLKEWEPYAREIEKKQKDNEDYWLGKHFSTSKEKRPLVDNLIFESLETFLPIATRPKADPVVEANNTQEGQAVADKVRKMLSYIADILSFNLKMKQVARYWALYMLGAMKVGWSMKENDITCVAIRPQKLVLDPKATVEECEYTGEYIGELIEDTASNLVLRFPKKEKEIKEKVQGKMGTKVEYYMWSTHEYVFWTLDDEVLEKKKNPHWNYDKQEQAPIDEMGNQPMNPDGTPATVTVEGKNHFKQPRMPYIFLSIFNVGKHPHDDTNLIQQTLPLQDLINKRLKQIDKNADNANSGLIVSGDAFTEEQANNAARALRNGGAIWVPTGDVDKAVRRDAGTPMPNFVYESLLDYRNELRNIYGTRGSTPQGTVSEQTVRGKTIIKGQDADRIGGGISTYLEEFADHVFNWFVQLMYVYYDEPHMATVLGKERAKEYITLVNSELNCNLLVGVKDGSMMPTDPVSKRNEAIDLWSAGALDPITLFERLEFPNPREAAKQVYLWKADPIQLFPDLAAQAQKEEAKPPSESINYKDLPIDGKIQMAAQAGIQLDPAVMEAEEALNDAKEREKAQQQSAQRQQLSALAKG